MRVVLGNRHAISGTSQVVDGETQTVVDPMPRGKRATIVDIPDELPLGQALTAITHPQGVWASHAKPGAVPAWVASDSPGLAALLAEHFGGIEIRDLEEPQ